MKSKALNFVVLIGVMSFFADFVYEGARSLNGQYLAILGASATLVGFIAGLGEFLGYGLRLVSGGLSERTGQFWPITIFGYIVQMAAVPMLALAPNWQIAGLLIVTERIGKAIRNPPRDVMLSHAGQHLGVGWAFGLHEGLDQFGALSGPLVMAVVLARIGNYKTVLAVLLVPALVTLAVDRCRGNPSYTEEPLDCLSNLPLHADAICRCSATICGRDPFTSSTYARNNSATLHA